MKIMAAISLPRLCFTDNIFCAMHAFSSLGIPVVRGGTVVWEQGLSRTLLRGINEGYDVAFTIDYDSVFLPGHVEHMIDVMEKNGWIDALVPIQSKRGSGDEILFQNNDDTVGVVQPDPREPRVSKIKTGHFGLTAIRLSALAEVRKPWLLGVPNEDGDWGNGRIDPDMYFWKNWAECGREVYLANRINIGHMQLMTTWPDQDLSPYSVTVEQWNEMETASA